MECMNFTKWKQKSIQINGIWNIRKRQKRGKTTFQIVNMIINRN